MLYKAQPKHLYLHLMREINKTTAKSLKGIPA